MPDLQVRESPREQASDEVIAWDFDLTARLDGQSVSSATAKCIQLDTGANVSATCIQGVPTVNSPHVTVVIQALTARKKYRVTLTAVFSGGTTQDADLFLEAPH